jgi:hypothetical protein
LRSPASPQAASIDPVANVIKIRQPTSRELGNGARRHRQFVVELPGENRQHSEPVTFSNAVARGSYIVAVEAERVRQVPGDFDLLR